MSSTSNSFMDWRQGLMGLQPRQNSNSNYGEPNALSQARQRLSHLWHRSHIGHRSEYSVERLLAFRDYYQRTSFTRAVAVCVLTPMPSLCVALALDCIPLRPPSEGWQANYAAWIRLLISTFIIAMGLVFQVKGVIVKETISAVGGVTIAGGAATSYVLLTILLAALWRFPVPFGYVFLVGVFVLLFWIFTLVVIGRRELAGSKILRQQIKSQIYIFAAQGIVAVAYPVFNVVFIRLSGLRQTAFVLVLPVIKFVTKQIIANAAASTHEFAAPVVVFSVDVFNVFYIGICMQAATSTATTLIIIASDIIHVILAVRAIFHQANVVRVAQEYGFESDSDAQQPVHYLHDLPTMVRNIFPGALTANSRGRPIRIFSPYPLALSGKSITFINALSEGRREAHVYSSSRTHTTRSSRLESQLNIPTNNRVDESHATSGVRLSFASFVKVKANQVVPVSSTSRLNSAQSIPASSTSRLNSVQSLRKGSAPRRLLAFKRSEANFVSATALRAAIIRRATEKAVWVALQALFHSEYLLLSEYIEFMLPTLNVLYLALVYHLPVAIYYPYMASMTPHKLIMVLAGILAFAVIEFVGFAALVLLLRRKMGFSPLYQLAFVLETQAVTLQGNLFVYAIYIVQMMLKHYGTHNICFDFIIVLRMPI